LRRLLACLLATGLLAGCSTSQVSGAHSADWPMFRGDLSRNGHPPGATLTRAQARHLHVRWTHTLPGAVDGTPVVVDGLVYVASFGGRLDAYHLDDGAQAWSDDGIGAVSSSPAIAGRTLVVTTLTGHAEAFDATNGRKLWDYGAPGNRPALWASPAIYRRTVVIGIASQYGDRPLESGRVVALDLATGKQRWAFCVRPGCAAGSGVWSSAAIDDAGHGYVGTGNPDDGVLSFDVGSGEILWSASLYADRGSDLDVGATPIVFLDGTREEVAVGSNGGVFAVLDAGTGKVIWSRHVVPPGAVHGLIASPSFDGTAFYVGSASAPTDMFALNARTGATLWQRGAGMPIYSATALGNGVVVFGAGDFAGGKGGVFGLSTADGSLLFGFDDDHPVLSGPSIAGSTVIAGDAGGNVTAYGP
jgi:outer membrane protein assembly factor BamB